MKRHAHAQAGIAPLSRRRFLKRAAGALAAPCIFAAPSRALASPNERIGLGLIGCGSLGTNYHLPAYLTKPEARFVAVCDVDPERLRHAAQVVEDRYGSPAFRPGSFDDYRALLDRREVDAVIVVTPDHWHALQTIHACQAGKDVHCEKPLSLTVEEGRAMVRSARRYGRIVQVGSESRSKPLVRFACEIVRSGRAGKLQTARAGLGQNPFCPWEPPGEPPPGLDWNLWLGPAPWRPYHKQRCHYTFRWFKDYSGGKLTDWGAHMIDIAQWGIGADATGPVEVVGTARYAPGNLYEFPPDFEVTYTYASGVKLVATSEEPHVAFQGTAGAVRTGLDGVRSDPPELASKPLGPDELSLYASSDHDRNWLECIRTRRLPVADIEIGHRTCTVCHLGNIALWTGRRIRWDPEREEIVGDEAASRLLARPMRPPWHL